MKIIELGNGKVKLTAPKGVIDIRVNRLYSEVITSQKDIKYFIEYNG